MKQYKSDLSLPEHVRRQAMMVEIRRLEYQVIGLRFSLKQACEFISLHGRTVSTGKQWYTLLYRRGRTYADSIIRNSDRND